MIALNLTAKGAEQEIVKKYLEENAREALAEKINNGVRIEKDGKVLINRKTLDGFIQEITFQNRPCKSIALPNMNYGLYLA